MVEEAEAVEPKPPQAGTAYGQRSPGGQWFWNGTGAPDDDWVRVTEEQQRPEQQTTADETAALTQLSSSSEPLRHSVTPAVSDFTGISSPANLLASLTRWHAQAVVNGLVMNEAGGGVPTAWRLTHVGAYHATSQGVTKTAPAITGLAPTTASIAAAAGHPVVVTVTGTSFRGTQVVQVAGVTIPATYTNKTTFTARYTLPASPGTVQFSVYDAGTGQTSNNWAFAVTA